MPAPTENITRFNRSNPYPGIDINNYVGKYKGKVLFVTGVSNSNGLGAHTAKAFAKAGANIFISARNAVGLEKVKKEIEQEYPDITVASAIVDVAKKEAVKAAVDEAVTKFGRIDFVVANAGVSGEWDKKLGEADPDEWWSVMDINFKGAYVVARYTIPELVKTKGYIIFLGSVLGQGRYAKGSSYDISKHVINRLAEYVVEEYGKEGVKAFSVHPGSVLTEIVNTFPKAFHHLFVDSADLGPFTQVRLVSGSEDWLSGRYVSSNWDLDELNKYKAEILEYDALKNRLALPPSLL